MTHYLSSDYLDLQLDNALDRWDRAFEAEDERSMRIAAGDAVMVLLADAIGQYGEMAPTSAPERAELLSHLDATIATLEKLERLPENFIPDITRQVIKQLPRDRLNDHKLARQIAEGVIANLPPWEVASMTQAAGHPTRPRADVLAAVTMKNLQRGLTE